MRKGQRLNGARPPIAAGTRIPPLAKLEISAARFNNRFLDFLIEHQISASKTMDVTKSSTQCLRLLSQVLLGLDGKNSPASPGGVPDCTEEIARVVATFSPQDFAELWSLANSHHVVARAFPKLHERMVAEGQDQAEWVDHAVTKERARIQHALTFLAPICEALREAGDVIVIRSEEHTS